MLAGIYDDLGQDFPELDRRFRSDSVASELGQWVHRSWDREDAPVDSIELALAALHQGALYLPVRSAYESAKNTGRIDFIENDELRDEITRHYEGRRPSGQAIESIKMDMMWEFWRAARPYIDFADEFGGTIATTPGISLREPWAEVRQDVVLRNALVHSVTFRRMQAFYMRAFASRTERLREMIAEELGR